MANHNRRNFPRTYAYAAEMLFARRVQSMMINDDLALTFVRGGVAALYHNEVLVRWSADGRRVHIIAARDGRRPTTLGIEYISLLIPIGYAVKLTRSHSLLLHTPYGRTTLGIRHRIDLPGTFERYDPFQG